MTIRSDFQPAPCAKPSRFGGGWAYLGALFGVLLGGVAGIPGCSGSVVKMDPPGSGGNLGGQAAGGESRLLDAGIGGAIGSGGNNTPCAPDALGCQAVAPHGCGDGENSQEGLEECDDGNTLPGDGCSGDCKIELNWDCPTSGPCHRRNPCGDGVLGPGEVCDDGNTRDGDGCDATCAIQDPAYFCAVGSPCTRIAHCGNNRIEVGEDCEDGNTEAGDGCDASCHVERGYVCPQPGAPCQAVPHCGDGVVTRSRGEICDDGNTADQDGCASDCKSQDTGCLCPAGQPCQCPTFSCGNGVLDGIATCDDGNAKGGDGCSSDCSLEPGYTCPLPGAPCVSQCGDGIVLTPMEQCDPGVKAVNMDHACSANCRWRDGWVCSGTPLVCRTTKCGDGKVEGGESCDDGNTLPGDGCSPGCRFEPSCSPATGTCSSRCGDGLVVPAQADTPISAGGACDDGNTNGGDGCSADCVVEPGFLCQQSPYALPTMTVPIVYRDFAEGGDFEVAEAIGKNLAVTGLVLDRLDENGKPVASGVFGGDGAITSAASFAQWYTDVPGTNTTFQSTLTLHADGRGGFVNWWKDNQRYAGYLNVRWCADSACATCNGAAFVPSQTSVCLSPCTAWEGSQDTCAADFTRFEGNPLFFPLDAIAGMITPASQFATATLPPSYGGWIDEPGKPLHNFGFTSEVRTWFGYVAGKRYELDFTGDDDVWVFINRRLAVDMGGIHTPVNGKIVLDATGGGTVSVTPTDGPQVALPDGTQGFPTTTSTVDLGMQSGGVYEIAVFQAERRTSASTYKLTLSGFNDSPSQCQPICGNAIVSPGEQCDNGDDQNLGGYNQCTANCLLGPHCGDGIVNGPEECDDGENRAGYGDDHGCAPGCKRPPRCGDGIVQAQSGEACDDGPDNLATTDPTAAYGPKCMADCKLGAYCGDGIPNGTEACDDGVNNGTFGTCNPDCTLPPRCGDGTLQPDYGEECEPTMSNDPDCTPACLRPGGCGDGVVQPPEKCDNGARLNTGNYGGCAPNCLPGPRCGDGIKNGPEECDDGEDDSGRVGRYGGCTKECTFAAHCGDGILNGPEECDDGAKNGTDASTCSTVCKMVLFSLP